MEGERREGDLLEYYGVAEEEETPAATARGAYSSTAIVSLSAAVGVPLKVEVGGQGRGQRRR